MRPLALVLTLACSGSPTLPAAGESPSSNEGAEAPEARADPPVEGARADPAPGPEAAGDLDPAPLELRARWRVPAHLGAPATLVLESVGSAPARFRSELVSGDARCVLSAEACLVLHPGARLERPCPALEGAVELQVTSCPPAGVRPREVRVATP